jgi:hypothetical protein
MKNRIACKWCKWNTQVFQGRRMRGYLRLYEHVEETHSAQLEKLEEAFGKFDEMSFITGSASELNS